MFGGLSHGGHLVAGRSRPVWSLVVGSVDSLWSVDGGQGMSGTELVALLAALGLLGYLLVALLKPEWFA